MKRTLFFILTLLFFVQNTWSQVKLPVNKTINSALERATIQDVLNEQEVDDFMLQLSVNFENDDSAFDLKAKFSEFINETAKKRAKLNSDELFISYLYFRTHKKYLKNYHSYSSFNKLINKGDYDCLSATIMYALLLQEFDFDFRIIETNYHIYLLVNTDQGKIMLESTDPINGLITDEDEIDSRIKEINDRNRTLSEGYLTLQENERSFNNFYTLAGLQYYNASVQALNNNDVISSIDQLEKARIYDDSDRIKEFGKHIARVLVNNDSLTPEIRQQYLLKLTRFLNDGVITASL